MPSVYFYILRLRYPVNTRSQISPATLSILEIILPVMLVGLTQYPARSPRCHHIGGQILCHYAARTHYHIIPDCNAGQKRGS